MPTTKQNKIIYATAVYLTEQLMNLKSCSRDEAVELLLKTSVYEALMDPSTEIYLESRESVLDMLKAELADNPYKMLAVWSM